MIVFVKPREMKLRHAAALALVGWYLMVPPQTSDGRNANPRAPLSQWAILASYDTADECEKRLSEYEEGLATQLGLEVAKTEAEAKAQVAASLARTPQCIASDDPRLKGE